MTNEEALKWFEARLNNGIPMPAAKSAFQAAIEALRRQDVTDTNVGGMVSRQAVLDLWDKYHYSIATNAIEFDSELRALPSVEQPNSSEIPNNSDMVSRQEVLKLFATHDGKYLYDAIKQLPSAESPSTAPSTDCISRQAAIDALGEQPTGWSCGEYEEGLISQWKSDVETIKQLPSAKPKTGWWIDDGTELGCQCSECGKSLDEYINCGTEYMTLMEIPKFCPNCGLRNFLKMEVDNESNN